MTATAVKERKKKAATTGGVLSAASLARAIAIVAPAVPGKSPRPVLQNVLLSGGTLSATDLELRITTPLPAYDGPPLLLPYHRLAAIVNTLHPTASITLTVDGTSCVVKGGSSQWRLPVEDPLEFPVAVEADTQSVVHLPGDQFATLVGSVRFATDNETSRFALGGVRIEWKAGMLSLIGTDGRRMCVAETEVDQATDDAAVNAPRRVIDVLYKLAKSADAIQIDKTATELVAEINGTVVQARLIDAPFPRWRDVEPKRSVTPTQIVVGELLHACRQAAICTSEQSRGVDFVFTPQGVHLSSQSADYGQASVTCDVVSAGHACRVKLDPAFVLQWLDCGSFDTAETIEVEAEDDQSAVVLRAQDCRCVIMPLAKD